MALERRRFLERASGALVAGGVAAIAGCSSSCPDTDRPTPDRVVSIADQPVGPFDEPVPGAWTTDHGTAGRTGFAPGSLPVDPAVRWRTDLEIPATDQGSLSTSAPTVGSGQVFVADSRRIHALSLRTGALVWESEPLPVTFHDALYEHQANTASPTVGPDGNVYVGTSEGLVALDRTDGSVRWTVEGLTDVASPAVVEGTIFALGADALAAVTPSGDERWRRPVDRGADPVVPAVDGATVVVVTADGLRGFEAATGEERWRSERRVETHPVLEGGTCLVGNADGLHAIDAETGTERWTFSRGDFRSLLSPVVAAETVYVVEQPGEAGAASFALDRTDGKPEPRWCSYIGSGAVTAATDDVALATLSLGEGPDAAQSVVAFSTALGQARWAIEGGSRPRDWVTPPAVVDGGLVVTTRGGTTVAIGEVGSDA